MLSSHDEKATRAAPSATTPSASTECLAVSECLEFGVVSPNSRNEHGFMSAVTNGMPALVVTVPGAADVIWLACPVQGSCVGVTNLLNGGHGDYSLATFTLSYTGP